MHHKKAWTVGAAELSATTNAYAGHTLANKIQDQRDEKTRVLLSVAAHTADKERNSWRARRNVFTSSNGSRSWPFIAHERICCILPSRQLQIVQKTKETQTRREKKKKKPWIPDS